MICGLRIGLRLKAPSLLLGEVDVCLAAFILKPKSSTSETHSCHSITCDFYADVCQRLCELLKKRNETSSFLPQEWDSLSGYRTRRGRKGWGWRATEMGLSAGGVGCGVPEATAERFGLCGKGTAEFLPSVAEGGSEGGGIRMQSTARAVQGAEASQGHPSERASLARVPAPPCHPSSFPPSPAAAGPPSAERPPVSPARADDRPAKAPAEDREKKKKKSGSPLPAAPGRPQRAKRGPGGGGLRARTLSLWLARAASIRVTGGAARGRGRGLPAARARAEGAARPGRGRGGGARGGGAAPPAPRWALSANERRPHAAAAARGEAAADKCY